MNVIVFRPGIRGFNASASLKRGQQYEAPDRLLSIRGFNASASLKRSIICFILIYSLGIRGFNASASLKPVERLQARGDEATHPRLQRLGLIEALRVTAPLYRCPGASEASTPRPH